MTDAGATAAALIARAAMSSVGSLFAAQARRYPERIAVDDGARAWSYEALAERVRRLSGVLVAHGLERGSRIAILSENRCEYLEVFLAAASLGVAVACQGLRLTPPELGHCIELVEPALGFASPKHAAKLAAIAGNVTTIVFGDAYEQQLRDTAPHGPDRWIDPEDPLLILYTSGTTGLPKGALISHRAEIFRNLVMRAEFGLAASDTFVAWSPLSHMGAADPALGALMSGGKVIVVDGFDRGRLAELVRTEEIGWLLLMPGMVAAFATELEERGVMARSVRVCGVMADLVPPGEIAHITRLLGAPYANTFGSTETGCPPCSSNLIPIGTAPTILSKEQSPFCDVKLIGADEREVAVGEPGELCMRGPTLFSGYFRADAANVAEFRGGWFHMGDVFVRNHDGTLDFVDRVKYLIKSGGESIYPAEIERVLLQEPRVAEAAVVRRADARWGEVPVAFVARRDPSLTEDELYRRCRTELAGYKQPKEIWFIALAEFPRSASGKIQRHELERRSAKKP
jgi:acyl-CoA synthetase (AMP-forming)/AMP-acid ligase II